MQAGSSLSGYEMQLQQQKEEIVNMVRTTQSNVERMALSALIVLEVHNNDILNELIREDVSSVSNFLWMS
jgi:dynein heavy chain